jgi:hypothetical protein
MASPRPPLVNSCCCEKELLPSVAQEDCIEMMCKQQM